jgi:hypothetical protein
MTKDLPKSNTIRLADNQQADTQTELCCHKLKELAARLDQFHNFAKGQFVRWKPGLKNRKFPDYGEPVILAEPNLRPERGCGGKSLFSGTADAHYRNISGRRLARISS